MSKSDLQQTDMTSPWVYGDIRLKVEDRMMYANKSILCMWSPVFKAMFEHGFKEHSSTEITLPDKKYEDVLELMKVLHPPNKEIEDSNVEQLLPLVQEYQVDVLLTRVEEWMCNQAASVKNYLFSQHYSLPKLNSYCLQYLKRVPINRLKNQQQYEQLDQQFLVGLLTEKLERFECCVESLREVRMVLERKKPTTFPGMSLLCEGCNGARDQQVDCSGCLNNCCHKLTSILRNMDS